MDLESPSCYGLAAVHVRIIYGDVFVDLMRHILRKETANDDYDR